MRAIVVYESIFGHTRAVAEAVASGLRLRFEVCLFDVGRAPRTLVGVDLLVLGAAAHAKSRMREPAHAQSVEGMGSMDVIDSGVPFLLAVDRGLASRPANQDTAAAIFATVIRTAVGSATPAARRLEAWGYRLLARPEHFYVEDSDGSNPPALEHGELDRARAWGVGLADAYLRVAAGCEF